jgi:hypothetical protein
MASLNTAIKPPQQSAVRQKRIPPSARPDQRTRKPAKKRK